MKLFFIFLLTTLYNTHTMEHLIETNLNNPFLSLSIFSDEQVPQEIRENLSHQLQEYLLLSHQANASLSQYS